MDLRTIRLQKMTAAMEYMRSARKELRVRKEQQQTQTF